MEIININLDLSKNMLIYYFLCTTNKFLFFRIRHRRSKLQKQRYIYYFKGILMFFSSVVSIIATLKETELKTLEWDISNPNYLIWVSNGHTFDFLRKPFFLGYSREKSKTGFFKFRESFPFLYVILNGAQNFKFINFLYATLIGWILYTF